MNLLQRKQEIVNFSVWLSCHKRKKNNQGRNNSFRSFQMMGVLSGFHYCNTIPETGELYKEIYLAHSFGGLEHGSGISSILVRTHSAVSH
jgi:hypothetical protein